MTPAPDDSKNAAILAVLRAIVDAGGPSAPVVSGARPPVMSAGPRKPTLQPEGGEILGRAKTIVDLLNALPLGLLGDAGQPLESLNAAGPMAWKGAKGSMTLYRGVRQAGDAHLRGRQGGKLVSAAMDQVGEKGAFFSRNPGIAKEYLKDIDGAMSPDGGIWVTKANKKDAPPHWMSRMWGESSHIVDVDKQRGKLRYIPTQEAWRSPHAEDAIKRRAAKELSGSADDTRRALAERLKSIRDKYGFMLPIMGAAAFEQWSIQKAAEETPQAEQLKQEGYQ